MKDRMIRWKGLIRLSIFTYNLYVNVVNCLRGSQWDDQVAIITID